MLDVIQEGFFELLEPAQKVMLDVIQKSFSELLERLQKVMLDVIQKSFRREPTIRHHWIGSSAFHRMP